MPDDTALKEKPRRARTGAGQNRASMRPYPAIAPRQVVAARNSYGGTGFEQVGNSLQAAWSQISAE